MEWGGQQEAALVDVNKWLTGGTTTQQVYRLFGFAGTGKTTLAKHLCEGVKGQVLFAAFTGKAALVLKKKGCPSAQTIHSLIYNPQGNSTESYDDLKQDIALAKLELSKAGESLDAIERNQKIIAMKKRLASVEKTAAQPRFSLKEQSPLRDAALLVLDEASMVDKFIGADLESFGCPILVLGDPAQLPPIKGTGHFTDCEPDTMLTEIHRQAKDCPIIRLATLARECKPIPLGNYGSSRVVQRGSLDRADVLKAEQIIVGRNATRTSINKHTRKLLGFTARFPQEGDKLVCLRNHKMLGLLNGGLWQVAGEPTTVENNVMLDINSLDEQPDLREVPCDGNIFVGEPELPWWEENVAKFDFGYALTTHKAQGSQFANGYLFDESASFRQDQHRHRYTGITRFAESVTIVVG